MTRIRCTQQFGTHDVSFDQETGKVARLGFVGGQAGTLIYNQRHETRGGQGHWYQCGPIYFVPAIQSAQGCAPDSRRVLAAQLSMESVDSDSVK
jgi:hypothetical protein